MKNLAVMAACAAAFALPSQAAVVTQGDNSFSGGYASEITYEDDNIVARRGTNNNRDDWLHALGDNTGDNAGFFEIGLEGSVVFRFGTLFTGGGEVLEVTFGSDPNPNWLEFATVETSLNGSDWQLINNSPIDNQTPGGVAFLDIADGPWEYLRFTTANNVNGKDTRVSSSGCAADDGCGGYDIAMIKVTPVPVPAAGFLLLGGLGGLIALKRRKTA